MSSTPTRHLAAEIRPRHPADPSQGPERPPLGHGVLPRDGPRAADAHHARSGPGQGGGAARRKRRDGRGRSLLPQDELGSRCRGRGHEAESPTRARHARLLRGRQRTLLGVDAMGAQARGASSRSVGSRRLATSGSDDGLSHAGPVTGRGRATLRRDGSRRCQRRASRSALSGLLRMASTAR